LKFTKADLILHCIIGVHFYLYKSKTGFLIPYISILIIYMRDFLMIVYWRKEIKKKFVWIYLC